MTKSERRQVAATLREWAAWCEANPDFNVYSSPPAPPLVGRIAMPFIESPAYRLEHRTIIDECSGPGAATGLLLAAAAVESGDVP